MDAWAMTTLSLFPHLASMPHVAGMQMSAPGWSPGAWALLIAMWWIMMIAMMAPSATPALLLYARVHRHATAKERTGNELAPVGAFAAGYLSVWLAYSVIATVVHWALDRTGLISSMMMGSQNRWLSFAVLLAAGVYQLSPLKSVCLAHCRSPASFLTRHWRPHASGAFSLGVLHGAFCVGCCWVLMGLLFVGGVMNLVWIAALAVLVLIEKALPAGAWVGRGAGVALIAWSLATLLV
ncbi:MAG TPA: DUF2182 domain-containing protein [Steroidobacteraceae bacterium]